MIPQNPRIAQKGTRKSGSTPKKYPKIREYPQKCTQNNGKSPYRDICRLPLRVEFAVKNRTYFLFSYKNQTIPSGVQIRKSFDVSVTVKYSCHFPRGLLIELQWHFYQNKIAVGFLKITFYSLGKVTSLLGEKSVFSVIASKSLKSSLFNMCRTRLELKAWST